MPSYSAAAALTALLSATSVAAHGHVTNIVINGASYEGFDINVFPYETDFPAVVGWTTPNTGNGFISPDAYNSSDIICHENATNAQGYATVAAGDSISIQWTAWPESHHGPVIDYLASCGDDCTTVDKTTLEFFKIDGGGLIDDTTVPGDWATDALIDANSTWLVTIPSSIAPGNYVLRHELIALHGAEETDGAQNYPQCFNLKVTGSGTDVPTGTLGTELYTADEAGIYVNIYSTLTTYEVPGPTLYSGGTSMVSQVSSAITASVNATTGAGGAAATGAASSAVASVSAAASSAASSAVAASSAAVSSAAASTPVAASSTAAATSVAAASSAPAATSVPASTFVTSVAAAASSSSSGSTACKRKRAAQQL